MREGALIGRAGFDVVQSLSPNRPQPEGSHNVIPGNLGERHGDIGAL